MYIKHTGLLRERSLFISVISVPPEKSVGGLQKFRHKKGGSLEISMRKKGGLRKFRREFRLSVEVKKINLLYIHIYTI